MSEEISVPEMSDEQKAKFQEVLQGKKTRFVVKMPSPKGKEPEEESAEPKPESELMRKLRLHASKTNPLVPSRIGRTREEEAAMSTPCVWVAGAVLVSTAVLVYFGFKWYRSYGFIPEELINS